MIINRVWAMPNKWTFTIKPIRELLSRYVHNGYWCDPFAGENSPAQIKNDLCTNVEFKMDAIDFLKTRRDKEFDGVLLDPPYSLRQVSEHYKKAGIKITGWHTSAGHTSQIKNEVAMITKEGGKVISFGWNSMGLGKNRGFRIIEILLVPHGGSKNDTIVTVEIKDSQDKNDGGEKVVHQSNEIPLDGGVIEPPLDIVIKETCAEPENVKQNDDITPENEGAVKDFAKRVTDEVDKIITIKDKTEQISTDKSIDPNCQLKERIGVEDGD